MQINEFTQTESEFEAGLKADRGDLRQFYEMVEGDDDKYSVANPGYRLAPVYFRIYLERRPSKRAAQALAFAFRVWRELKGVSNEVRKAVGHISEEDASLAEIGQAWKIWETVAEGTYLSFDRDDQLADGLALLAARGKSHFQKKVRAA